MTGALFAVLFFVGSLQPSHTLVSSRSRRLKRLQRYSFEAFVQEFERTYEPGTEEWSRREKIFNASLQHIIEHEGGPKRSWSKGVTKFMDYTDQEFKKLLGYKGSRRPEAPSGSVELFGRRGFEELPASISLGKDSSSLVGIVRDQGMCGSCWAEAATAVLEGVMEKNATALESLMVALNGTQKFATLSSQTMVSCTPNPRNCGGKGGCEGATAELGFEMVKKRGIPLALQWNYVSGMGGTPQCKESVFSNTRLHITGYEVAPSNKLLPLKEALVRTGAPIVVSVDASGWSFYSGGIYSDTDGGSPGQFTVNHAVVLTGYTDKTAESGGYWLIKNSWGQSWGERGFIRLEMKDNEESHCGWDYKTHDGLACDGDPDTAWVCGTCGVLYDSSYPTGPYVVEAAVI